jgi:predicted porin
MTHRLPSVARGALVFVCIGSAATLVAAQSVTAFGILDVNLRNARNGSAGTLRSESSDGINTSRIGFRGQEDLGDGDKAGFWLEAAVLPDTGGSNATRFWNRRATVSLSSPRWGEVRLGRDTTTTFNTLGTFDPFGTNGLGEVVGNGNGTGIVSLLGSGADTLSRSDNQVSYFLPATLGGVYGQLAVAPGESAAGKKTFGGRIGYAKGPINVSFGYLQTKVALGDNYKQAVVGGSYDFGPTAPRQAARASRPSSRSAWSSRPARASSTSATSGETCPVAPRSRALPTPTTHGNTH